MNLRQSESSIRDILKLKKENNELKKNLFRATEEINKKLDIILDLLLKAPDNCSVSSNDINISRSEDFERKPANSNIFIPAPNTDNLKTNMKDVSRVQRKSNVSDSVNKLSKLH